MVNYNFPYQNCHFEMHPPVNYYSYGKSTIYINDFPSLKPPFVWWHQRYIDIPRWLPAVFQAEAGKQFQVFFTIFIFHGGNMLPLLPSSPRVPRYAEGHLPSWCCLAIVSLGSSESELGTGTPQQRLGSKMKENHGETSWKYHPGTTFLSSALWSINIYIYIMPLKLLNWHLKQQKTELVNLHPIDLWMSIHNPRLKQHRSPVNGYGRNRSQASRPLGGWGIPGCELGLVKTHL
jgi:hypothetical protein